MSALQKTDLTKAPSAPPTARRPSHAQRRRSVQLRTARDIEIEPVDAIVDDPYAPGERQPVQINRRVDALQIELDADRITTSQFTVGRVLQAVFERASGSRCGGGAWNPGDRVDMVQARELTQLLGIVDGRTIDKLMGRIRRHVGGLDATLIREVLGEARDFKSIAERRGYGRDKHMAGYYARRFRDALAQVDDLFAARGPKDAEIRGERVVGDADEEHDARGVLVPAGQGFRLAGESETGGRWTPPPTRNWTDRRRAARSPDEARAERARIRAR